MKDLHISKISTELKIPYKQVSAAVELLDNDATIPFIARYRKEATGSLNEVAVASIRDRITQLRELDKRREAIIKSLRERDLLNDELELKINSAETMAILEDIYLPFKPKRRTRMTIAVERGLEPLAEIIFAQDDIDPQTEAETFINRGKEVESVDDALAGARDIIAGWINEDTDARTRLRKLYAQKGMIKSKVLSDKETEGVRYSDYFDWSEPVTDIPSHRLLAMRRGENEGVLKVTVSPPEDEALAILEKLFVAGDNSASEQVRLSVHDSYKRLLAPAMETEIRNDLKKSADQQAIRVFTDNLRELLMLPPLGKKNVLAIDPGFRTGCKVVCLDRLGKLLDNVTIYPHDDDKHQHDAAVEIKALCEKNKINVIAIGNGTAGRETEIFIRGIGLPDHILIEMVNEAGASVYSASETAREEFPDYDITVRGAVSIGRRLMDPLAELVKIDPKSIGVGQYQHDVDQSALRKALDDTVISCVNAVGVDINTASKQLLTYVSGLGKSLAQSIVDYRDEKGPFKSRAELKKVPRLGPRAFEQSAGFIRVRDSKNPLDRSAVHPESYHIVKKMAKELECTVEQLIQDDTLRKEIDLEKYVSEKTGIPTLQDIMDELAKPGRDPRPLYEPFSFNASVKSIDDLKVGMKLPGIVTNVTGFGAFVDIGVHQDGLVHKSELSDSYIKNPAGFIKVYQRVKVTVLAVDLDRKRISLSLREDVVIK